MDNNIRNYSMFMKSIFGYALVCNHFLAAVVDIPTIADFQHRLTSIAKARCLQGNPTWKLTFHSYE